MKAQIKKLVFRFRQIRIETKLLVLVLMLAAIGILVVFDASFPMSIYSRSRHTNHDPYFFGREQAKGLMAGLAFMAAAIYVGYVRMRRWAGWLMIAGALLLLMVWAPKLGHSELHAARWINLGHLFQPSEIAKFTLVLFLAHMLARPDCDIKSFSRGIMAPLYAAGIYMALIFFEPDLGTTIVVFATLLTMLKVAGAKGEHILAVILLAPILIVAKGGLKPGQVERIHVFRQQGNVSSGAGYQTFCSKLALGSGEIFGVGWGQGKEKYVLPEANSDFIFATVGEEFGLLGASALLLMFAMVSWCGVTIARQTEDPFGRLLAMGLTAIITWQACINIAVVTISIPATGVPLPFISYGSTSLVVTLFCVGVLVSIAQNPLGLRNAARR